MTLTPFKVSAHPLKISNLKMENEPGGKNKQNLKKHPMYVHKNKTKSYPSRKKIV